MKISIFSKQMAEGFAYPDKSIIISITTPFCEQARFANTVNVMGILRLQFYDLDAPIKLLNGEIANPMTKNDAILIRDFVKRWENKANYIFVHCEAGISRSAGIAGAIMRYFELDADEVWSSGKYVPNMRCFSLTLSALMSQDADEK